MKFFFWRRNTIIAFTILVLLMVAPAISSAEMKTAPLQNVLNSLNALRETLYGITTRIESSPQANAAQVASAIQNLQPGHWYEVPDSKMWDVRPPEPLYTEVHAVQGQHAVFNWSGGAFDTKRNRLIVWGGGHGDYAGNELYVFDLNTLKWSRLTDPSSLKTGWKDQDHVMPDGTPVSRHTYGGLVYLPDPIDRFWAQGGSIYAVGWGDALTWYFDFNTNKWIRRADAPAYGYGNAAVYNAADKKVYESFQTNFGVYDPTTDSWKILIGNTDWRGDEYTADIDTKRQEFVMTGNQDTRMVKLTDPNLGSLGTLPKLATTGDKSAETKRSPGFVYMPNIDRFVAWNGGADIYLLDPNTRNWTRKPPAPTNTVVPTQQFSTGTFGRFRYSPQSGVFVVVNNVRENVYIYKPDFSDLGTVTPPPPPPPPTNPAPTLNLSVSPTSLTSGGSATLTWSTTNATSCTASGGWSGTKSTGGTQNVGPLTTTTSYSLTCTGSGGSVSRSATVSITAQTPPPPPPQTPTLTFTSSATSIASGGTTNLSWTSTNATSCSASGSWTGTKATSGSQIVGPLTGNASYTLSCTGPGGTEAKSLTVTVTTPPPQQPPPTSLPAGKASLPVSITIHELLPQGETGIARNNEPASFGIPLTDADNINSVNKLSLTGAGAYQFKALSFYPSGNVQWVLVDTIASVGAGGTQAVTLRGGSGASGGSPLAGDAGNSIVVNTGAAQFSIRKQGFNILDSVTVGGKTLVTSGHSGGLVFTDSNGVEYTSLYDNPTITVAENGPAKAVIKAEGRFKSSTGSSAKMGYTVYLTFYKGQTAAKIGVTMRNAYDSVLARVAFNSIELVLPTTLGSNKSFTFAASSGNVSGNVTAGSAYIYQGYTNRLSTGDFWQWDGNYYMGFPVNKSESGIQVVNGGTTLKNLGNTDYTLGWGEIKDESGSGITAAYKDMAAYFPSSFEFGSNGNVTVGLFSKRNPKKALAFDWATHESRDVMLDFHTSPINNELVKARLERPLFGRAPFDQYRNAGAFLGETRLASFQEQQSAYASVGRSSFSIPNQGRIVFRLWDFNQGGTSNQRDQTIANQIDYVRTGNGGQMTNALQKALFMADQFAWHSDDFDFGTKSHMYIDGVNGSAGKPINGGYFNQMEYDVEHIWVYGLITSYYFTGDERYKNGFLELAESAYNRYNWGWDGYIFGRGGISSARMAVLSYMMTKDQRYLNKLNRQIIFFLNQRVTHPNLPTLNTWSEPRGYIATGDSASSLNTMFLNTYYPVSFVDILRHIPENHVFSSSQYPGVTYTKEDLRDYAEGLAYFLFKEAYMYKGEQKPYMPYMYDTLTYADAGSGHVYDGGMAAAVGYELTGDVEFLNRGKLNARYVDTSQEAVSNSEPGNLRLLYDATHPSEISVNRIPLTVAKNGSSYTLSWTVPAGAIHYQLKYADKEIVPNLNYNKISKTYEFSPASYIAFWAAKNIPNEPTPQSAGSTQTFTISSLSCGSNCFFALRSFAEIPLASFGTNVSSSGSVPLPPVTEPPTTPAAPTVNLSVSSATISPGNSVTLTWSSSNATSCTASGGWSGSKATSGTQTISSISANTTFTLACTGAGGTASKSATVTLATPTVPASPAVTFTTSSNTINSGGTANLSWTSTNATSCLASGSWTGTKAISGSQIVGPLTTTSLYHLTCTGAGGSISKSITINVDAPPAPTVTFTPSSATISPGNSVTLTWSSSNATSCTASGGWSGSKTLAGTQSVGPLTSNTTFTLLCTGPGGIASKTVNVTTSTPNSSGGSIPPPPPPPPLNVSVTLTASPQTVEFGKNVRLNWTSTNATYCLAGDGWSGNQALSGETSVGPITQNTSYTLNCTGPGGSASKTINVEVKRTSSGSDSNSTEKPAPSIALQISPSTLKLSGSATLTWSTRNATSCTASGGWSGSKATRGTQRTGALKETTTFTLTCKGSGGSASKSITVNVEENQQSNSGGSSTVNIPSITLRAVPQSVVNGGSTSIIWSASHASSCTASGGWSGTKRAAGSQVVGPITTAKSFTLTCRNDAGSEAKTITVEVRRLVLPSTNSGAGSSGVTRGPFTRTLSRGISGNDVKILQEFLTQDLSLYTGGISGTYDANTERAIQLFQLRHGVVIGGTPESTGYGAFGPKTQVKFLEVFKVPTSNTPPQSTNATRYADITATLFKGMIHPQVVALQKILNADPDTQIEGDDTGSPGKESSFFGSKTEDAVKRFQTKHGIVSSGNFITTGYGAVGAKTRVKLNEILESLP